MNLPNQLTLARLVLSFIFVALLSIDGLPLAKSLAVICFTIAAITDFLDGYLARKHNLVTNFGKLMDPLADKILMSAGFVILVKWDMMPAWMVVVILTREFLVTGLRQLAIAEGRILAAENLGKYKTGFQIATVLYFLFFKASRESWFAWMNPMFQVPGLKPEHAGVALIWISLILTLWSGWSYVWKNRSVLSDA